MSMPPDANRAALVATWLDLTQHRLPAMAAAQHWPIRLDHCFMRVCLDAVFGKPWHEAIGRPAIRHASDAELLRAIAVAEGILAAPGTLVELNRESLRVRGKGRKQAVLF